LQQLESQLQPEYDVRVKLAALETEVEQLVDTLPASRGTEVVARLVENNNMLKTVSEYQARQINDQQTQLETLRMEIEQLKARQPASPDGQRSSQTVSAEVMTQKAVPDDVAVMIAGIIEKNTFMEAVIKHQANVLKTQNEHLKEIEAKLAQLQFPEQPLQASLVLATAPDNLQQDGTASLANGIKIVERKARRGALREIFDWFKN
jgi:hypothetical protein